MTIRHQLKSFSEKKKILFLAVCFLAMIMLTGCPPTLPCDKKIKDPTIYEKITLTDPVISQINSVLSLRKINIAKCIVNRTVGINIWYNLPADFSEFNITYSDYLNLSYSLDGNFRVDEPLLPPPTFNIEEILSYFRNKVNEIENDPRVREVIQKTDPDPLNPVLPIFGQVEIMRSGSNRVEYNFYSHKVRAYLLSNNIEWQEFPEIEQAQQIIKKHLLVGDLSDCMIGQGDMHSYTTTQFFDEPGQPWRMTVALICGDRWKDAYVQINPDGTFEQLKIITNY